MTKNSFVVEVTFNNKNNDLLAGNSKSRRQAKGTRSKVLKKSDAFSLRLLFDDYAD